MGNKRLKELGVMIDCSRNAVIRPETVEKFADIISAFGYNQLQLYTEDTYEIAGEQEFGYMRGRYTASEIKRMDKALSEKGVELVPCIQTLAHLKTIFRHRAYGALNDIDDCLDIGEEKTYELIEKMIKTTSENFSSRKINLGMDEAMRLGFGKYYLKHGYKPKRELLAYHVNRVYEIAKKYGYEEIKVFHDQFAWSAFGDDFYYKPQGKNEEFCKAIPKDLEIVYWDYGVWEYPDRYNYHIKKYSEINGNLSFAGGAYRWSGFFTANGYSIDEAKKNIAACKANGIDKYLVTLWGDGGGEASVFSVLPTLYSVAKLWKDEEEDTKEFKKIVGEEYSHFMLLDKPNYPVKSDKFPRQLATPLLYSDVFYNVAGGKIVDGLNGHFKTCAEEFSKIGGGEFKEIFAVAKDICAILSLKSEIGNELRKNYSEKNLGGLKKCVSDIDEILSRLAVYEKDMRALWLKERKPFGYEYVLLRVGALQARLSYCRDILAKYLNGEISSVEELEEQTIAEIDDINELRFGFVGSFGFGNI